MPRRKISPRYVREICARTQRARLQSRYDEPDLMARQLGVLTATYVKYEHRGPIQHDLIEAFCEATGMSVYQLITGKHLPLDDEIEADSDTYGPDRPFLVK